MIVVMQVSRAGRRLPDRPLGSAAEIAVSGSSRATDFTSLTAFEELPEHQLSELSDEQLVDYLRAAREAGAHEAMKPAIGMLVYGYWDVLVNRARLKLPPADVEDVASEAMSSAIASAFDGKSVGEFRAWLHTILSRRIADHLEARKRKPKTEKLATEHDGSDEVWGDEPSEEFEGDALFASECLKQAYAEIENDDHRRVIDLHVLGSAVRGRCRRRDRRRDERGKRAPDRVALPEARPRALRRRRYFGLSHDGRAATIRGVHGGLPGRPERSS